MNDKDFVFKQIDLENSRQMHTIELIASENFPSRDVLAANGSCLTAKYTEGYPEESSISRFMEIFPEYRHTGKVGRYYGGCSEIDMIELFARLKFQQAFGTDYHVNVQPHSGSSANMAAYMAVLKPNDTVLAMNLNNGGHLTHGSPVNFSGKLYDFKSYGVDENGFIDYDDLDEKARRYHPRLIVAGASAYSRIIDFDRIGKIAKREGALFMVDMAHIAGLIVAGDHPSPFGIADIITSTTHKTLRGTRGGLIFCTRDLADKIDSAVFPCCQGGALQHIIAAKAVTACEACTDEYCQYIHNVVRNAKAMSDEFIHLGYDVVTGGTDNHLFLIDLSRTHPNTSGRDAQILLEAFGITLNKNCVPNEKRSPTQTSGIRIGTAAETTRGLTAEDFVEIAQKIDNILR